MSDTEKYVQKAWKKENGKVHLIEETGFGYQVVIVKSGRVKRYLAFHFSATSEVKEKAEQFKKHDRVKCRFVIRSVEHKGRWYTNLELKDIQPWQVNEKKKEKDERIKRKEQQNASNNNLFNQNSSFLSEGPNENK